MKKLEQKGKLHIHYMKELDRQMRKWTTMPDDNKQSYNEKSKLRMRRYRLRKKEEKEEQEKLRSGDRRR
jgi:hypothetical protein